MRTFEDEDKPVLTSASSTGKMSVMKTNLLFIILGLISWLGMPGMVSPQQVDITALVKSRSKSYK